MKPKSPFIQSIDQLPEQTLKPVDWKVLDNLPIEQLVNNFVLVMNLDIDSKQRLLESPTVKKRLGLFSRRLEKKIDPILASAPKSNHVN